MAFKVSIEMGVATKKDAAVVQELLKGLTGLLPESIAVKTTETPATADAAKKASGKKKPEPEADADDSDDDAGDDSSDDDDDAEDEAPKSKGKKADKAEKPAKGKKADKKAKDGDDESPDLNDVRASLAKLAKLQPDGFKQAKKLLKKFGVADVKELDDENYAQVIEEADEIVAKASEDDGDGEGDDADEMFG